MFTRYLVGVWYFCNFGSISYCQEPEFSVDETQLAEFVEEELLRFVEENELRIILENFYLN